MDDRNEDWSPLLQNSFGVLRDAGRLHEILLVFIRYGFADVVHRLGMADSLGRAGRLLDWDQADDLARLSPPARARHAMQDLGPTFVKVGQMLAGRADLLPPEWIAEFELLQDQVSPVEFSVLRQQLEQDLGAPPEDIFASIDLVALAAASIGQVHRARLVDGREVVLKIRRPGIRAKMEADLRLLALLARNAAREFPSLARFRPARLVRQVSVSLRQELDFSAEGRNAERVAESFSSDTHVRVPKVYWEWTCERLNVQEFVAAIPVRDAAAIRAAGLDPRLLASRGTSALLQMTLEHGFFHADPHAGNVFAGPDNEIVMIDWGMVGRLTETRRRQVIALLLALVERDSLGAARILSEWVESATVDFDLLHDDLEAFIDRYHGVPLKRLDVPGALADVMRVLRQHRLSLPPELALMIKAITTIEGLGRILNPDYQIIDEVEPVLRRLTARYYGPRALLRRGWLALREGIEALSGVPLELQQVVKMARRGQLRLNVDSPQLERFGAEVSRAANRLTIGLVTAACILGGSIFAASAQASMPWLSFYVLLGAGLGGLWLLVSIWRSGRR